MGRRSSEGINGENEQADVTAAESVNRESYIND